ncbi:MAG: cysteine desulfurase family protein [Pirellulaceae bacterium]|nr:cysteine desulfurase [Planctomycetales bacterium]
MRNIYLDYNATTPIAPSVLEATLPFLQEHFGNPSSSHSVGRAAVQAVRDAREKVAVAIGAEPEEIVFTSGGTESNNLALLGIFGTRTETPGHLIVSKFEHPAVCEPAAHLAHLGHSVSVIPCDVHGVVDPVDVAEAIRDDTRLVSVMHANNEIGTLQPIDEIARICRKHGVLFHTDAAQSIGKVPVRVDHAPIDMMTIAGHKCYAPKGIGALFVRHGTPLHRVTFGAGHERGLRPGTENVPYIVALGKACELVANGTQEESRRMETLRDHLQHSLLAAIDGLSVNGQLAPRLPNTLSANFPRVAGHLLLSRIPQLAASTGAACHSGAAHLSNTLAAIGLSPEIANGTVRLSLGWQTSRDDVDRAAELLVGAWEQLAK